MEILKLKKAIIYADRIVLLRKSGNIDISINNIDHINYTKPTFFNQLYPFSLGSTPRLFEIFLRVSIDNKNRYALTIKYKDFCKLRNYFGNKIEVF